MTTGPGDLLALLRDIANLRGQLRDMFESLAATRVAIFIALADPPRKSRRRRATSPQRPPRELTERQREAILLMARHNLDRTAAAHEMGVSRQVFSRHYDAAKRKLAAKGIDVPLRRSVAATRQYRETPPDHEARPHPFRAR